MKIETIVKMVVALVVIIVLPTTLVRCTRVDSSEVGIKFNKLSQKI